jgi:hypothetical protein
VKLYQGIQHQQSGPKLPDRLPEPRAVSLLIKPENRRRDHIDRHLVEIETAMPGHPLDALAHDQERILGQVN